MHANIVLCLFPPSDPHPSTRTCLQSIGHWLRKFFRRFCFCLVVCVWSLSFTATIPLLYTIDSNEKILTPVYCPGTTDITYLDEWFDRNRIMQTTLFNLIPLLISLVLTIIALSKLSYDYLFYIYMRLKMSKCSPCRDEEIVSIESCRYWFSTSILRLLLVLSTCLFACIYPIVMRFYLIYFSVLIPLIFAAMNYSLKQLPSTQQQLSTIENDNSIVTNGVNISRLLQPTTTIIHRERDDSLNRPIELENLVGGHRESSETPSTSSIIRGKPKYVSNNLYENTQNMFLR